MINLRRGKKTGQSVIAYSSLLEVLLRREAAIKTGDVVSHENAKKRMSRWLNPCKPKEIRFSGTGGVS